MVWAVEMITYPLKVERHNLVEGYYRRLTGNDSEVGINISVVYSCGGVANFCIGTDEMCSCVELLGMSSTKTYP